MADDLPIPMKVWVGVIATGLWVGAVGAWGIGWIISRTREAGSGRVGGRRG